MRRLSVMAAGAVAGAALLTGVHVGMPRAAGPDTPLCVPQSVGSYNFRCPASVTQVDRYQNRFFQLFSPRGDYLYQPTAAPWDPSSSYQQQHYKFSLTAESTDGTSATWSANFPDSFMGAATLAGSALSPDGSRAFLVGTMSNTNGDQTTHYCTDSAVVVAISITDKKYLWADQRDSWGGTPSCTAVWDAVAPSPDGTTVFVTGRVAFGTVGRPTWKLVTAAYVARNGQLLWSVLTDSPAADPGPESSNYAASIRPGEALDISPDGSTIFVGAYVWGVDPSDLKRNVYLRVTALDARSGAKRWFSDISTSSTSGPLGVFLSPQVIVSGSTVYAALTTVAADPTVTLVNSLGVAKVDSADNSPAVAALDAQTGHKRWEQILQTTTPYVETPWMRMVVAGNEVYLADTTNNVSTAVGYDAATGTQLMAYTPPDGAVFVDVCATGSRLYAAWEENYDSGSEGAGLDAVDGRSGQVVWTSPFLELSEYLDEQGVMAPSPNPVSWPSLLQVTADGAHLDVNVNDQDDTMWRFDIP